MTLDDMTDECWRALPAIRKRLAGRDGVKKLLIDAIQEWDSNAVLQCKNGGDYSAYEAALLSRVRRRNSSGNEYGFAIMIFLLMAVASAVISWLVQWWLDHVFNRIEFEDLKRGLAG